MADYKKMYIHLFQQVERAVRILQQAQLDCEEIYISTPEPEFKLLDGPFQTGTGPETDSDGKAEA